LVVVQVEHGAGAVVDLLDTHFEMTVNVPGQGSSPA
jgi:hypothetical protein